MRRRQHLQVAWAASGIGLFGAAMALRDRIDPWWSNAAVAALVIVACIALLGRRLRALLEIRWAPAAGAAALGLLLVGLTHLAYHAAVSIAPAFAPVVEGLYANISDSPNAVATLPLIAGIVLAEELLFRGLVLELLEGMRSTLAVGALAVALYATPQIIGGSPVLIAAAVALGVILTTQRLVFGRLTEPLITHAIWSVSVFGLVPVA